MADLERNKQSPVTTVDSTVTTVDSPVINIDCKKYGQSVPMMSPIDSLKNSFEAVYGGYGWHHLGKSWEIQKFRKDTEFYDVLCQIMAKTSNSTRRNPLSAVNQS